MRLILHIGAEKTGSTAFQKWGALNRDAMRAQGVCYSREMGWENHAMLFLLGGGTVQPHETQGIFGRAPETLAADRTTAPDRLAGEVAQARADDCHTFLMSNEHCQSRLLTPGQVARLRDLLASLFDDITVLCCLRPQFDMGLSHMSTILRYVPPVRADYLDGIRPGPPYFDYLALYDRWATAYGADAVEMLPYKRGPSLFDRVATLARLDTSGFQDPPSANSALDLAAFQLRNALHSLHGDLDVTLRRPLNRMLNAMPVRTRLEPGRARALAIQQAFDASNAALAGKVDTLTPEDLAVDPARYAEVGNLDALDRDDATSLALADAVWALLGETILAQARQALAEAERAVARGNPDRVTQFATTARHLLTQMDGFPVPVPPQLDTRLRAAETKARTLSRKAKPTPGAGKVSGSA